MKTINLIFTPQEIDEIRHKGQEHDRLVWWFGDKANDAYFRLKRFKGSIINEQYDPGILTKEKQIKIFTTTQQDIFNQVGEEAGKSGRTIRLYAELSSFYVGNIRELYNILPVSHFEFAKQFPGYHEDILEFSLRSMDGNNGKPRSVAWLGANLSGILGDHQRLQHLQDMQDVENSIEYGDLESAAGDAPEYVSPIVYHLIRQVPKVVGYLRNGIAKWDAVSPEDKSELFELIDQLEKKICDLSNVMIK